MAVRLYGFLIFLLANLAFGQQDIKVTNVGELNDIVSVTDQSYCYYRFSLAKPMVVSIFFNGLSAGYQADLLDDDGNILSNTVNAGSSWPVEANAKSRAVVLLLKAQTYYLHVYETIIQGNPLYKIANGTYTLNFIPDNAPNLTIIAANDSPEKQTAHYVATGFNDEKTINLALQDLKQNKAARILLRPGTYYIGNNILTTRNNLTLMGTGWETILKIDNHAKLFRAGVLRSRFNAEADKRLSPYFYNQHFMHFAIDGNKSMNPYFQNNVGNFGTYLDSAFEDVRFHDFSRYGFDPHGIPIGPTTTKGLTIKECLADHNDQDGIVCDACEKVMITGNVVDANGRHGINIVTGSLENKIVANVISNNGRHGVTIQRGKAVTTLPSKMNDVEDNKIINNGFAGINIYLGQNNELLHNTIADNNNYEIILKSTSYNLVKDNLLKNKKSKAKIAIALIGEQLSPANHNLILNNKIGAEKEATYQIGINEVNGFVDFNLIQNNQFQYVPKPIRLAGAHSLASDNVNR